MGVQYFRQLANELVAEIQRGRSENSSLKEAIVVLEKKSYALQVEITDLADKYKLRFGFPSDVARNVPVISERQSTVFQSKSCSVTRFTCQTEIDCFKGHADTLVEEISRLETDRVALEEETRKLKKIIPELELELQDMTLNYSCRIFSTPSDSDIARDLPVEILTLIFQRVLPPHFLLDSGICAGPDSVWCVTLRQKLTLMSVCHAWHAVGINFLYEDVCLRRLPQLAFLLRTLKESSASGQNLGHLIKVLDIQCYIPEACARKFNDRLHQVLQLSQNLANFSYTSPCLLPPKAIQSSCLESSSISHLRLDRTVCFESSLSILKVLKKTLRSVRVHLIEVDATERSQFVMPLLQTFHIEVDGSRGPGLLVVKDDWIMPTLRRLTIRDRSLARYRTIETLSSQVVELEDNILAFIERYGRELLFLHIDKFLNTTKLKRVMEFCPCLERLAIPWSQSITSSFGICHPTLRWIDLTDLDSGDDFSSELAGLSSNLPSCQGIRTFYNLPAYLSEWFQDFDPLEGSSDTFSIEIFQHHLLRQLEARRIEWDTHITPTKRTNPFGDLLSKLLPWPDDRSGDFGPGGDESDESSSTMSEPEDNELRAELADVRLNEGRYSGLYYPYN